MNFGVSICVPIRQATLNWPKTELALSNLLMLISDSELISFASQLRTKMNVTAHLPELRACVFAEGNLLYAFNNIITPTSTCHML